MMMHLKAAAVALAAALALSGAAQAAEEENFLIDTAADLAKLCAVTPENPAYDAAIHMCHGYLVGVHHFHEALAESMEVAVYCEERASPVPTRDEVTADFVAWLGQNPTVADEEALEGLLQYAAARFPCS